MQSFSLILTDIDHAQTSDSALQSVNKSVNFHTSIVLNQYNMNLNDQNVDDESVIAVQSNIKLNDEFRILEHQLSVIFSSHSAIIEENKIVH